MTAGTINSPPAPPDQFTERERPYQRLRMYNLIMGVIHLIQAVAILILSNDFSLPVTTSYLAGPPGSALPSQESWFDLRVGPLVALFLGISAFAHFLLASPWLFGWYARNLARGINYARWWEYFVSASIMIVLIAGLVGMTDFRALAGIFALTSVMNLCGLAMELHNHDRRLADLQTNWTTYIIGCIAGGVPWILIVMSAVGANERGEVPTFVFWILVSLFLFFNSFAVNMWLQYRKIGPWRNYLFGEAVYVFLSLTAKSALAWQVFSGTLMD